MNKLLLSKMLLFLALSTVVKADIIRIRNKTISALQFNEILSQCPLAENELRQIFLESVTIYMDQDINLDCKTQILVVRGKTILFSSANKIKKLSLKGILPLVINSEFELNGVELCIGLGVDDYDDPAVIYLNDKAQLIFKDNIFRTTSPVQIIGGKTFAKGEKVHFVLYYDSLDFLFNYEIDTGAFYPDDGTMLDPEEPKEETDSSSCVIL